MSRSEAQEDLDKLLSDYDKTSSNGARWTNYQREPGCSKTSLRRSFIVTFLCLIAVSVGWFLHVNVFTDNPSPSPATLQKSLLAGLGDGSGSNSWMDMIAKSGVLDEINMTAIIDYTMRHLPPALAARLLSHVDDVKKGDFLKLFQDAQLMDGILDYLEVPEDFPGLSKIQKKVDDYDYDDEKIPVKRVKDKLVAQAATVKHKMDLQMEKLPLTTPKNISSVTKQGNQSLSMLEKLLGLGEEKKQGSLESSDSAMLKLQQSQLEKSRLEMQLKQLQTQLDDQKQQAQIESSNQQRINYYVPQRPKEQERGYGAQYNGMQQHQMPLDSYDQYTMQNQGFQPPGQQILQQQIPPHQLHLQDQEFQPPGQQILQQQIPPHQLHLQVQQKPLTLQQLHVQDRPQEQQQFPPHQLYQQHQQLEQTQHQEEPQQQPLTLQRLYVQDQPQEQQQFPPHQLYQQQQQSEQTQRQEEPQQQQLTLEQLKQQFLIQQSQQEKQMVTPVQQMQKETQQQSQVLQEKPQQSQVLQEKPQQSQAQQDKLQQQSTVQQLPVQQITVQQAPTQQSPVAPVAVQQSPMQQSPAPDAAGQQSPMLQPPVADAAGQQSPVAVTAGQQSPVQQSPVQQSPVQQSPVADAAVQQSPVDPSLIQKLLQQLQQEASAVQQPNEQAKILPKTPMQILQQFLQAEPENEMQQNQPREQFQQPNPAHAVQIGPSSAPPDHIAMPVIPQFKPMINSDPQLAPILKQDEQSSLIKAWPYLWQAAKSLLPQTPTNTAQK